MNELIWTSSENGRQYSITIEKNSGLPRVFIWSLGGNDGRCRYIGIDRTINWICEEQPQYYRTPYDIRVIAQKLINNKAFL